MIQETEDTILWENLKENTMAVDQLMFILVMTKVMICVSPLLSGKNDAVLGIPADKWGWLSNEEDTHTPSSFTNNKSYSNGELLKVHDDFDLKEHTEKYGVNIDEHNKVLERLELQNYINSPETGKVFDGETFSSHAEFAVGNPKEFSPGGDPLRILRSKNLYDKLLIYYALLSSTYGKTFFEAAAESWVDQTPIATMDMPGFHGSQSWCLRGVLYISLNLYLLKMENLKIKNEGPTL